MATHTPASFFRFSLVTMRGRPGLTAPSLGAPCSARLAPQADKDA